MFQTLATGSIMAGTLLSLLEYLFKYVCFLIILINLTGCTASVFSHLFIPEDCMQRRAGMVVTLFVVSNSVVVRVRSH